MRITLTIAWITAIGIGLTIMITWIGLERLAKAVHAYKTAWLKRRLRNMRYPAQGPTARQAAEQAGLNSDRLAHKRMAQEAERLGLNREIDRLSTKQALKYVDGLGRE